MYENVPLTDITFRTLMLLAAFGGQVVSVAIYVDALQTLLKIHIVVRESTV